MSNYRNLPFNLLKFLEQGFLLQCNDGRYLVASGEFQRTKTIPQNTCSLYLPDFYLRTKQEFLIPNDWIFVDRTTLLHWFSMIHNELKMCSIPTRWNEPKRSQFQQRFDFIKNAIASKEIEKAVPVMFATQYHTITSSNVASILFHLLHAPKHARAYGYWNLHTQNEGLLGATPELLFTLNGNQMNTMALAGTLAKGMPSSLEMQSFLNNPKERHEHSLVVQGICESIQDIATCETSPTAIMKLPHFSHLITHITAQLHQPISLDQLVHRMHPTPALGVFPRTQGLQWLAQIDPVDTRYWFGSPFVVSWPTVTNLYSEAVVAIRNMQWKSEHIQVGAGCGIVEKSLFEQEWNEIQIKHRSTLSLLGIEKTTSNVNSIFVGS